MKLLCTSEWEVTWQIIFCSTRYYMYQMNRVDIAIRGYKMIFYWSSLMECEDYIKNILKISRWFILTNLFANFMSYSC